MPEPEIWQLEYLLRHIQNVHLGMEERAFCFLLGAGASRSSEIPLAQEMVDQWLEDLYVQRHGLTQTDIRPNQEDLETWATSDNLDIQRFHYHNRAEFYPEVYRRRFGNDREEGYSFLERTIESENVQPGLGYSILAQILTKTRHRVVVTTNFDDLIADAISMFANNLRAPLVCGHEALTQYIRPRKGRPVIAKVHRDLLLGPMSEPQ